MAEREVKFVSLTPDKKSVALTNLRELSFAVSELHKSLSDDKLTEQMRETYLTLAEYQIIEAGKAIGYDSDLAKEVDRRHADIRRANMKVHELEQKLAEGRTVDGLKEMFYAMHMALYSWWGLQGFDLVTDDEFGQYGYKGRFCPSMRTLSLKTDPRFHKAPITADNKNAIRLQKMKDEEGWEFDYHDHEYLVLDTPGNRQRLIRAIKKRFPSAEVTEWHSWQTRNNDDSFCIRDFEVYIRDLSELHSLIAEMKDVKDPEDE